MKERFDPSGKLATHPQFALHLRGEKVYPIGIEISPCGWCSATCDFCWYAQGAAGNHRKVSLGINTLANVLTQCQKLGVKAVTWTGGGDPSLYPQIMQAVDFATVCGLDQGMFTNALIMPKYEPAALDWIRVTMTDRPYKPECIKPLRACKTLGFAFNYAGPQDDAYLAATLALAEDVGADYVQCRPALAFNGQTADIKPPRIDHRLLLVTGYKFDQARVKHWYKTCEGYHFVPFLWEDGNLDVCAYMRGHDGYTLGNVYKDSLKDIIDRAPASVAVRPDCQVCCKNHEINMAVHEARELLDVNFP